MKKEYEIIVECAHPLVLLKNLQVINSLFRDEKMKGGMNIIACIHGGLSAMGQSTFVQSIIIDNPNDAGVVIDALMHIPGVTGVRKGRGWECSPHAAPAHASHKHGPRQKPDPQMRERMREFRRSYDESLLRDYAVYGFQSEESDSVDLQELNMWICSVDRCQAEALFIEANEFAGTTNFGKTDNEFTSGPEALATLDRMMRYDLHSNCPPPQTPFEQIPFMSERRFAEGKKFIRLSFCMEMTDPLTTQVVYEFTIREL